MKILFATAIALLGAPAHAAVVLWDNLGDVYERYIPEFTTQIPANCRIDLVFKDMRNDRVEAIVECNRTLAMAGLHLATEKLERFAQDPTLLPTLWSDPVENTPVSALQPGPETNQNAVGTSPGPSLSSPIGQRTIAGDARTLSGVTGTPFFGSGTSTSGSGSIFDTVPPTSTNGANVQINPIALPDGNFLMVSGITTLGGRTVIDLRETPDIASVPLPASLWLLLTGVFAVFRLRRA